MSVRGRRHLAPYLVVILAALASVIGLVPRPASGAPTPTVDYVVIAGAAGLRWDDVNPTDTPTLWAMAQRGSIGALSVRSAHRPTCPGDGWLTLGAGNYTRRTAEKLDAECPPLTVGVEPRNPPGAFLSASEKQQIVKLNQELSWGAQPGALAESMRCTTTIGQGAALATARPFGRIDRYHPTLPDDPRELLAGCVLTVADLGTVTGGTTDAYPGSVDTARREAVRAADARLTTLVAARPERSLLIVAGLSDTDTTSRLHVAVADGPGYAGGWLTSSSTSRSGYLQLIDLAPTTLAALGRGIPAKLFPGSPALRTEGRPTELTEAVDRLADADREAGAQRRVTARFFAVLAFCQLMLFVVIVPLLRRARRRAGPVAPPPNPPGLERTVEVLLVAAALTVPAAMLAGVVPWWRTGLPGLVFAVTTLLIVCAGTAAVTLTRLGQRVLGPLGTVAAVAATVIAVDVLTGSRLQLNGVAGYSALSGGKYAGLGTMGLGVFIAGVLLTAGCVAQQIRRQWRPGLIAVAGGAAVVLVGSPYLGADAAGAVALTAGVCVAAAMSTGGWLTFPRVAWALMAGVAVTTGFALLDVHRPVGQRGSVGRFLARVSDGTSSLAIRRIEVENVVVALTSPLTLLVLGSAVLLFFALLRPWGGLKRLFGLYPAVRAGLAGTAVATLIAGPVEGVALNVAGAAVATALPLAALAALRILHHADERTQPAIGPGPDGGGPSGALRAGGGVGASGALAAESDAGAASAAAGAAAGDNVEVDAAASAGAEAEEGVGAGATIPAPASGDPWGAPADAAASPTEGPREAPARAGP